MKQTTTNLMKIEEQVKKLLGLNSIYELAYVNELTCFYNDYVFYQNSDLPKELRAKYKELYNRLGEKSLIDAFINRLYKYDSALELNYDTVIMLLEDLCKML